MIERDGRTYRLDDQWTTSFPPSLRCRWGSWQRGYCRRPTVAAMRRGRSRALWAYCDRHLYGRVVIDDLVYWPLPERVP